MQTRRELPWFQCRTGNALDGFSNCAERKRAPEKRAGKWKMSFMSFYDSQQCLIPLDPSFAFHKCKHAAFDRKQVSSGFLMTVYGKAIFTLGLLMSSDKGNDKSEWLCNADGNRTRVSWNWRSTASKLLQIILKKSIPMKAFNLRRLKCRLRANKLVSESFQFLSLHEQKQC